MRILLATNGGDFRRFDPSQQEDYLISHFSPVRGRPVVLDESAVAELGWRLTELLSASIGLGEVASPDDLARRPADDVLHRIGNMLQAAAALADELRAVIKGYPHFPGFPHHDRARPPAAWLWSPRHGSAVVEADWPPCR